MSCLVLIITPLLPPTQGVFKSMDAAYVLAYSVIMLNTDAHNPQVWTEGVNTGVDSATPTWAAHCC